MHVVKRIGVHLLLWLLSINAGVLWFQDEPKHGITMRVIISAAQFGAVFYTAAFLIELVLNNWPWCTRKEEKQKDG